MRKSKLKQISVAVCLALMPLSNYAAGLGKLNVSSGIGEPLRAEVELISATPEELATLVATIGSEDAYAQQGIPRSGIHNNIKVELAKNSNGAPVIRLRSSQPVSDPYLDVLLQVDWASGRLQREYTVLLDPPGYKPSDANAAMPITQAELNNSSVNNNQSNNQSNGFSANGQSGNVVEPVEVPHQAVKKAKKSKRAIAKTVVIDDAAKTTEITNGDQELTTKRGDTLSSIAKATQVEGVSLDQMLAGLYENNKDAFTNGNMNRLKVGQIIKVPSKDALIAIDSQEAKKTIKVHSVNWNAYRNALAGNVAAQPEISEPEQKQSSSGKIATAEDKAAPAKVGPQDVVKLSAGEKAGGKGGNEAAKSVEAKIIALQEETTAREKSLKEATERTAALEKQIEDMQKLIALKNQSMTELQKNAEAATKDSETKVATVDTPKAEETPKVETPAAIEKPAETAPVSTPEAAKVKQTPAVQAPVEAAAQEESGFLAGLLNSVDLTVLSGAGGVALLGAGWMFLRNKRRKDLDSFERGILTSGGLRANTVFGNTTGNASMSDTSFLTDFAQSADGSMIDTNDVDPIAEAEVYMAYGRDAQAEEILKDAISKEPKRYELHLKLLEMYAARKDTSAFEAIAGELYTTLGAEDPTWEKVAAIGVTLEPGNPLYNLSKSALSASLVTEKLAGGKTEEADAVESESSFSSGLDFSLDDSPASAESLPVIEDANSVVAQSFTAGQNTEQDLADNSMDFDLGDFKTENPTFETEVESAEELTLNDEDISALKVVTDTPTADVPLTDFDIDFNLPADNATEQAIVEIEKPEAAIPLAEIEDVSFDLDFSVESENLIAEPQAAFDANEISFDLPSIEKSATSSSNTDQSNTLEANNFDLSEIDLSLSDAETELPAEKSVAMPSAASNNSAINENESQDVNIKLDLVAAYIDMDDKEGARELLEEVLKEGGTQQQLRAQQLLDSLA